MSSFSVEVRKIKLEKHPDPEVTSIELAHIDGYLSIVKIGDFKDGDLAAYIPEQAVVPDNILEEMNLVGMLGGGKKNIVKPRKLRGVFSQGLLYPAKKDWVEGQDVGAELGIVKYEIPEKEIPERMRGKPAGESLKMTVNFDIENVKKHNNMIQEGEEVVVSEKIHGTNVQIGMVPQSEAAKHFHCGRFYVTSKGLGGRGVILDYSDKGNVYVAQAGDQQLFAKIACFRQEHKEVFGDEPVRVIGEIFGPGIQAGFSYGSNKVQFRMFDISYGDRYNKKFVDFDLLEKISNDYSIPLVPVLYRGPFSKEVLSKFTDGSETLSGKASHIREGVVVKTIKERDTTESRASLKSVSEKYLLRKGQVTEYN